MALYLNNPVITGMKPQSPENSGETYSAADLPVRQAGLRGIKPSAFGPAKSGIRLTNFNALRFWNLSLTNKNKLLGYGRQVIR